jgi:serine/threonine protein kinase
MVPEQWEQVKEQFDAIIHLGAEERVDALARLQRSDPELCAKVEELVENDEQAGRFLAETLVVQDVSRFANGEIINGRYRIKRFIGQGGMGEVYEAYDNQLYETVALKTIITGAALNERYVARFLKEVKLARKIANRHVCRVHDVGQHTTQWGPIHFFTMELLSGETLDARLRTCHGFSTKEALPLIEQMAEALRAAHEENIIHRDFKPSNIMLVPESSGTRVVVTDFGLARAGDATGTLYTSLDGGNPPGTRGYIAPELYHPGAVATSASDIYSFGVVIRDMVSGNGTTVADSSPRSYPALKSQWEKTIRRCLEIDPERRFKSPLEVVNALRPGALPVGRFAWTRKHPFLAVTSVALLALLLLAPQVKDELVGSQTVTELRQITNDPGLSDFPVISHDGKLLVYASDGGSGNLNLYLRQIGSDTQPIRLTHNEADDYAPSFSADDTRIVFRSDRNRGGVYQIRTFGGEAQLLAQGGQGPSFSPDGEWIAYWVGVPGSGFVPGSSQVYVKPASGGAAKAVQTHLIASCRPVWAPDSKRLLVLGKPDTKHDSNISVDWWVVPLSGGRGVKTAALTSFRSQKLTPAQGHDWITPIAWLPSPNRILFSATEGDTTNLWEVPISDEGKVIGPATRRTATTSLDLHASAIKEAYGTVERMVFSSLAGRVNIWSVPIDATSGRVGNTMLDLTAGISYAAAPSISAAGTELAFFASQSKVWSVRTRDLQTGQEGTLTAKDARITSDARYLRPRISPDGKTVAYVDNTDRMYLVDRLTGTTETICDRCGPPTDISPDGEKILFEPLDPPEDVMMVDVPARRVGPLVHSDRPDHMLFVGRFSPDSFWVSFTAILDNSPNRKLFISRIHEGHGLAEPEWIPITDGLHVDSDAAWSPDGNVLYFLSERDGFLCIWAQRLVPATKQPDGPPYPVRHFHTARESLARIGRPGLVGLSVARDRLVFSLNEQTGNIWMEERKTVIAGGVLSRWISAISN